jgi:hypothetical protein
VFGPTGWSCRSWSGFPLLGRELIERVRQEHLISDASFDAEPYPDDRVGYLSAMPSGTAPD